MERDTDEEYLYYRVRGDPARPSLLHLAVEQNFLRVTKLLVEKYPSLVYIETHPVGENGKFLPVEKALKTCKDETAAYLISRMNSERWVSKNMLVFIQVTIRTCVHQVPQHLSEKNSFNTSQKINS